MISPSLLVNSASEPHLAMETQPSLSLIVIAGSVQSVRDALTLALRAIARQTYSRVEVVLVDDTVDQNLDERLGHTWRDALRSYRVIRTGGGCGRSVARNLGASSSDGEVLVFLDGDTILCSDDSLALVAARADTASYGFGARRYWSYPPGRVESEFREYLAQIESGAYEWLLDPIRAVLPAGLDRSTGFRDLLDFSFPGNYGFVRRQLFEAVGGFHEAFRSAGWEDDYFAYCLYRRDPDGFSYLGDVLRVLHVNHPRPMAARSHNRERYEALLAADGIQAFNINVLLRLPDYPAEPVLERSA